MLLLAVVSARVPKAINLQTLHLISHKHKKSLLQQGLVGYTDYLLGDKPRPSHRQRSYTLVKAFTANVTA